VLGVVLGGIVALMICLAKRSRQAVSEEGFPETGPASPEPILDRC
jgi:hypothetical protein